MSNTPLTIVPDLDIQLILTDNPLDDETQYAEYYRTHHPDGSKRTREDRILEARAMQLDSPLDDKYIWAEWVTTHNPDGSLKDNED